MFQVKRDEQRCAFSFFAILFGVFLCFSAIMITRRVQMRTTPAQSVALKTNLPVLDRFPNIVREPPATLWSSCSTPMACDEQSVRHGPHNLTPPHVGFRELPALYSTSIHRTSVLSWAADLSWLLVEHDERRWCATHPGPGRPSGCLSGICCTAGSRP